MISISRTFKKCLLATGLMLSAVGIASAQSGNYTFPLTYGPLNGSVFTSYTTSSGLCGNKDAYAYTQTTYTITGWSITGSGPSGGGALAGGSITFVTGPQQALCPIPGWQNPQRTFNLVSPGYFSSCSNPTTGWEGGYVTFEPFALVSNSKFVLSLPVGCPS